MCYIIFNSVICKRNKRRIVLRPVLVIAMQLTPKCFSALSSCAILGRIAMDSFVCVSVGHDSRPMVKKGKVFPYSLPSVGPGADPGVQAVSPQVTWSESRHRPAVGCHYFLLACGYLRSFHQMALPVNGSTHLIPADYSFIDPERMKGWVGWPIADGLPTLVVTHQLQVERRTGKVSRPEIDVLPLCHATN